MLLNFLLKTTIYFFCPQSKLHNIVGLNQFLHNPVGDSVLPAYNHSCSYFALLGTFSDFIALKCGV